MLKLPPRFQAWTLPQATVSRSVHGSGVSPVATKASPSDPRWESSQAFTPVGVGVEDGARGRRVCVEVALRGDAPAERPDESVGVELALAEELGQPPGRDVPPDLHLPHPFAGVDIALREEQVVRRVGRDVRDPGGVSYDADRSAQSGNAGRPAFLRERPAGDNREQADRRDHCDQQRNDHEGGDALDDAHGLSPPRPGRPIARSVAGHRHACWQSARTSQRVSSVPSPKVSARRRIAAPKTTSASPTPRWVATTRPTGGLGVAARSASPMVADGSG